MTPRVLWVAKSANRKTGPIPVTYTQRSSCPPQCPLLDAGCYAEAGINTALAWKRADVGLSWDALCGNVKALPAGTVWRHNVAGDLPNDGGRIDKSALSSLAAANKGKRGYTYTHCPVDGKHGRYNAGAIRAANRAGFTVNVSCDSLAQADRTLARGLPVTCVVASTAPARGTSPGGNAYAVCPAQLSERVTCQTCRLCRMPDRGVIVAFRAHGPKAKSINARLMQ